MVGLRFHTLYESIFVTYGIPVEVKAFNKELNLIGSIPSEDIVTGDPVIIGLNPNMAFNLLICNYFAI